MTKPVISVTVHTLNEERNLPMALGSVRPWVDDIVVVDMHSDDRTVEIARSFGARVFMHERLGYADPARAFALAQTTGDWVLILDADELIPLSLAQRLQATARGDEYDAVEIPRLNYFMGLPLHHTGWGAASDYQLRFFKRAAVQVSGAVHNFMTPVSGARVLRLPADEQHVMVHFNYRDLSHFIEKLNRYTSIEARERVARGQRASVVKAPLMAAREFYQRFVRDKGYRDGWRGFYLSTFMGFYRLSVAAKVEEFNAGVSEQAVERAYKDVAERIIKEYAGAKDPDRKSR